MVNEEGSTDYLHLFIHHVKLPELKKAHIILDNYHSHILLEGTDLAKQNAIILLTSLSKLLIQELWDISFQSEYIHENTFSSSSHNWLANVAGREY